MLTKTEVERRGLTPLADGSMLRNVADKDFAYNLGKVEKIEEIYKQKLSRFSKANSTISKIFISNVLAKTKGFNHQRDLYIWQKGLDDIVDEVIIKDNPKTKLSVVQVGFLGSFLAKKAGEILNTTIESGGIILTKKNLTHANPKRKEKYNHAFRVEEIKEIINVLDNEDNACIDIRDNHKNIVFVFEDKQDSSKINLIPIEISKIHKKFKQSNYIITLDKFSRQEFIALIKNGKIKKIK